ncbi:hypothetical protein JD844_009065 [Phrynosoma platyrhinos]|uniref:Uncharacterized protein n=1 Tax=Phrynosoma platyrhinos TaxID=52577 RepID=A0ABQ7TFN6_PHRPL|nr:hypothetical protein JD844_009065 [Phrynosoma platyrhinos]
MGSKHKKTTMKQSELWLEGDIYRAKLRKTHSITVTKLLSGVDDISIDDSKHQNINSKDSEPYSDEEDINAVTQGDKLRVLKSKRQAKSNAVPLTVILQSSVQKTKQSEPSISNNTGRTKRTTRSTARKSSFKRLVMVNTWLLPPPPPPPIAQL